MVGSRLILLLGFAVSIATASPVETSAAQTDFDVDIEEQGVDFQEHITIDEEENIEVIRVPSHNEVIATVFVHDFNLNLTLRVMAEQDSCYLTDLSEAIDMGEASPPGELKASLVKAQESDEPAGDVTVLVNQWVMGRLVENEVVAMLSETMKRECPGRPIRWLHRLHDRARVHSNHGLESYAPGWSRKKRDTFMPSCQPQNMKFRCKKQMLSCQYIYYETCDAERWRRGRRKYAKCIDNSTLHIIDEVKCCRECCSVESQQDDFFPYCESFNDFDCSEH